MAQPAPLFTGWKDVKSPDSYMPPAKRQRLSPGPMSAPMSPYTPQPQTPYATSPMYSNSQLPNAFLPPQRSLNVTPIQVPRPAGIMGPPQRPVEKPADKPAEKGGAERHMDINDLSDLVTSSGIDLREEENYLAASYRTDRHALGQSSQHGATNNGFDLLSQNAFGGLDAKRGFGPWGDSKQTAEEELNAKHKKAARAFSEKQQHHLDEPFLWGACLRRHLDRIGGEAGIRIPVEGLFDRIQDKPQSISGVSMKGADGAGVVAVQAPSILNRNTPLEGVISLLSLATNERLRGLLEDAYGLARGRQTGADGVVPPDWSDLAVGDKPQSAHIVPSSVSKTAWDQSSALPSPPASNGSPPQPARLPQPTTVFPPTANPLVKALTSIARRDRQAEEARLKQRSERRARKAAAAVAGSSPLTPSSANGGANLPPGMLGERAPEPKMSKKEREKLAKADMSEEVQTRLTNNTATMQLGGKAYSWMTGGKKGGVGGGGNRLGLGGGGGLGASLGTGGTRASSVSTDGLHGAKDRKYGEWREDSVGGKGVQLRDWISALEADGKEKKTLNYAMVKLGRDLTGDVSLPGPAA